MLVKRHHIRADWKKVADKYRNLLRRSTRANATKGHDSKGSPPPWANRDSAPNPPAPPDRARPHEP
eukprot:2280437-Pyramimonas_sp.AAC.1